MRDTEGPIAKLECELRRRGVEPPELRSGNPDPAAREAEQRHRLEAYLAQVANGMRPTTAPRKDPPPEAGSGERR